MTPVQAYNKLQMTDLGIGGHRARVMEENYRFLRDCGISHVTSLEQAGFTEETWAQHLAKTTQHPVHLPVMQHSVKFRRNYGFMDEELDCE